MGIDFARDLPEMLSADDHGAIVEHGGRSTEGILNQEFLEVEVPGGSVPVGGSEPAVYLDTVWAASMNRGDAVTVIPTDGNGLPIPSRTEAFTVATAPEPDGTGLSRVGLQTV